MSSTYVLRKGHASLADLVDGGSVHGYPGNYPGKVFYVNNITGSASYSGLSWDEPFAEVSTAITASAAALAAIPTSTNRYVRNTIYVQGTGTAYAAITAWPSYCDLIGVGADPRGNGTGIAAITGSSSAAAAGSARGLRLYNMQFIGSGSFYAATFAVLFRSVIENCTFVNGATGGLDITTGGGFVIRDCQIGCGDTTTSVTGFRVGSAAGNFNNCLVEDNMILGSTTGFENGAYLCNGTIVRNNTIYGGTKGVDDNSTQTGLNASVFYVNNFISGTDAMEISQNAAARVIGNYVVNGTTGAVETTHV
jgi:hypothetical protein